MEEEEGKENNLEDLLRAHSSHFTSMVELIPAKFYVSKEEGEEADLAESKYWINKRQKKTPKEVTKKAKKLKLDPEAQKSVAELQAEVEGREEGAVGEKKKPPNGFSVDRVQSLSLDDLQSRLKEKIESLRRSRKAPPEGKEDGDVGGDGGAMNEKVAVKRKKKKEKLKREKELKKKKLVSSGSGTGGGDRAAKGSAGKGKEREKEVKRVTFSKFDFSLPVQAEEQEKATGEKKSGKRDYKKLLAKAEAAQKKLDEIRKNDERRGRELEKRLQWQKALDMARGTKLKDDPKLLKKSLKRVEKKKQKSKKEWEGRRESEREAFEKRQEKRKRNIQARVDQVKARKIKKRMKKGTRRMPGF